MKTKNEKWKGLSALLVDGVVSGSRAIERIQKETAARPFGILERIPVVALPAACVHAVHDLSVSTVHGAIRLVTHTVGVAAKTALDVASTSSEAK
jgi:hypothetical protein